MNLSGSSLFCYRLYNTLNQSAFFIYTFFYSLQYRYNAQPYLHGCHGFALMLACHCHCLFTSVTSTPFNDLTVTIRGVPPLSNCRALTVRRVPRSAPLPPWLRWRVPYTHRTSCLVASISLACAVAVPLHPSAILSHSACFTKYARYSISRSRHRLPLLVNIQISKNNWNKLDRCGIESQPFLKLFIPNRDITVMHIAISMSKYSTPPWTNGQL